MAQNKTYDEILERLALPFTQSSIEFVVTFTSGNDYDDCKIGVAPYVKRESILTRLDVVVGPGRWENLVNNSQPDALYQGIMIHLDKDLSLTKWDGASLEKSNRAGNDRLDPIKTVVTNSFKRAAEVWGIGRYLKDLPPLHAVKMSDDDWNTDEWSLMKPKKKELQPFYVRWNHPAIPAQFLPEYMTPEQYVLLKGLRKHFTGEVSAPIDEYIKSFEEDWRSVSYEEVAGKIAGIREYISRKIGTINPKTVHSSNPQPTTSHERKPKVDPKAKEDPKKPQEKQKEAPGSQVNYDLIETLKIGMDGVWAKKDFIKSASEKDLKQTMLFINNVVAKKKPIPDDATTNKLIKQVNAWQDEADELPY